MYLKRMGCQFGFFTIICQIINFASLYYILVFCNIFPKSIDALFQKIFLTICIDFVVMDVGLIA